MPVDPVIYMQRCIDLALKGAGYTAPNPMVGAVLVYGERIIGEGWHRLYGQAHAEVNCIASVKETDRELIRQSTLYVSLEPCAHFGKTPPCADLIIAHKIPRVVIGCRDSFDAVDGKGMAKLRAAGINVVVGMLETACRELNKRFFTFQEKKRPYIILKWAQTADGKIAGEPGKRLLISNEYTNRLVHRWRSEEAAILVGRHTALLDDPSLTTRFWQGPSPLRLVIDNELQLPATLKLFDRQTPTIVFNTKKQWTDEGLSYYQLQKGESLLPQLLQALYAMNIQSVLVEGGARLLESFIDGEYWDEARVITNTQLIAGEGLAAPVIKKYHHEKEEQVLTDRVITYSAVPA